MSNTLFYDWKHYVEPLYTIKLTRVSIPKGFDQIRLNSIQSKSSSVFADVSDPNLKKNYGTNILLNKIKHQGLFYWIYKIGDDSINGQLAINSWREKNYHYLGLIWNPSSVCEALPIQIS